MQTMEQYARISKRKWIITMCLLIIAGVIIASAVLWADRDKAPAPTLLSVTAIKTLSTSAP